MLHTDSGGYVSLVTAIVVSAALLVFTTAVSTESYFSRLSVLETETKKISNYLAESCVHTAILRLAADVSYSVAPSDNETVPVGDKDCLIRSVSPGTPSSHKVIEAQGVWGEAYTDLKVEVNSASFPDTNIDSWEEIPNF